MPELFFHDIPEELHALSAAIERVAEGKGTFRGMNALFGWRNHASLRADDGAVFHHPCITSYERMGADFDSKRMAEFYAAYPQDDYFVSLAGLPGGVPMDEARAMIASTIVDRNWLLGIDDVELSGNAYGACPILVLTHKDAPTQPIAAALMEYRVSQGESGKVDILATLVWIHVDEPYRAQGLGHLMALEAGRWCGLQTRNILLQDDVPNRISQQATGPAISTMAAHLSTVFVANFASFSITDALVRKAKDYQEGCLLEAGSVMSGLATINGEIR